MSSWARRPDDANQLVVQRSRVGNGLMNPRGEGAEVVVASTNDDSLMREGLAMKSAKVAAIECEHGTPLPNGKSQNSRVRNLLLGLPCFLGRDHIMPPRSKLTDNRIIEVFIRVEACHVPSGLGVFLDGAVDFLPMLVVVVPGGVQVGVRQVRMTFQDGSIGQAELLPFDEAMNGMAGITDAGIAPTHAGVLFDPTCRCGHWLSPRSSFLQYTSEGSLEQRRLEYRTDP